jgi:hypothetical protein
MKHSVARPNRLCRNIVVVDGLSTSGKTLVAPVISSYSRCEHFLLDHIFEYFCSMDHLGQIDHATAMAMVQHYADLNLYNLMISRNVNFRETDESGVFKYLQSERYTQRLKVRDGDTIVQQISDTQPVLTLMTHNIFGESQLLFDAFADDLKLYVVTVRHPIDLIQNWYSSRFDFRIGVDPREFQLSIHTSQGTAPWYTYGWSEKFKKMNSLERAIHTTATLWDRQNAKMEMLAKHERSKLMVISFDAYIQNPEAYLEKIRQRLEVEKTALTPQVMAKLRIPRPASECTDPAQTGKRMEALLTIEPVSSETTQILERLCHEYESTYLKDYV